VIGTVLDTNVISESKKPRPSPQVQAWFEQQDPDRLYLTVTVVSELSMGIERLPLGRKRRDLEQWLDDLLEREFNGCIISLAAPAARLAGRLAAASIAQGRAGNMIDAQIAAVALRHGFLIATRDAEDFAPFAVPIVNPWTEC
jgi:predicted nucleic acid-binding protein